MQSYIVIESDDGLSIVEVDETSTPEVEAERHGGVLADTTTYFTYEDAFDAMLLIESDSARPQF